jgi:hypothetical protein
MEETNVTNLKWGRRRISFEKIRKDVWGADIARDRGIVLAYNRGGKIWVVKLVLPTEETNNFPGANAQEALDGLLYSLRGHPDERIREVVKLSWKEVT